MRKLASFREKKMFNLGKKLTESKINTNASCPRDSVAIQIKATEQYFPVVLFINLLPTIQGGSVI